MLTETELAAWYERLNFSESTRAVIDQVRLSDPARRVGGGRSNVSGFYPSRKMGVTIQFESHRVELAAIYEMEHDPQTLEFYDQPNAIALDYKSVNGRRQVVRHTPDFFVIRAEAAGWEEWKTEDELNRLAEHSPNRYRREVGCWHCPPGESHANQFGLYSVRPPTDDADCLPHGGLPHAAPGSGGVSGGCTPHLNELGKHAEGFTASAHPRKSIGGSSGMLSLLKTTCAPTPTGYPQLPLDESSLMHLHYPAFPWRNLSGKLRLSRHGMTSTP
jgi:TnsA endonuclease N terminal